jgi:transposase
MKVTTVGLALAKQVFSVHGVDEHGKVVLRKRVSRGKLLELFAQLPSSLVGMEACSGAHHWARELERLGHRVGIMVPRFVAPYRKSQKNDGNDAEAICEAVSRPNMRHVPVKSVEQQGLLVLHRVRQGLTAERTGAINQLRGLLAEFGIVLPKGRYPLRAHIGAVLENAENAIPSLARRAFADLNTRIGELDQKILAYDRELEALARQSDAAKRLQQIPGIGPITATALVASVADAKQFSNGRQFAAWLGLVPRQYTTGGHVRLGRITKRGRLPAHAPHPRHPRGALQYLGEARSPQPLGRSGAGATRHAERPRCHWPPRMRASPGCCSPEARTISCGALRAEARVDQDRKGGFSRH